jgi:IstB-like ATP binding protein
MEGTKMLTHPTEQRLIALGLAGMAKALEEQRRLPDVAAFAFEERLAMLVDREAIERENKRLVSRLKFAGLRQMWDGARRCTTCDSVTV